jgi:carboxymethylenebutenolidase
MIEETLDIATRDGAMETFICRPERGEHPPVLLLMDAPGIREEPRHDAAASHGRLYVCCPTSTIAPAATIRADVLVRPEHTYAPCAQDDRPPDGHCPAMMAFADPRGVARAVGVHGCMSGP